jgi:nucleoid-associated protein YgaU
MFSAPGATSANAPPSSEDGGRVEGDPSSRRGAERRAEESDRRGDSAPPRYTVEEGDSLWTIAERAYDASSPAEIAAGVDRLWRKNSDRIATGDRDLIHPDQELRL